MEVISGLSEINEAMWLKFGAFQSWLTRGTLVQAGRMPLISASEEVEIIWMWEEFSESLKKFHYLLVNNNKQQNSCPNLPQ